MLCDVVMGLGPYGDVMGLVPYNVHIELLSNHLQPPPTFKNHHLSKQLGAQGAGCVYCGACSIYGGLGIRV